MRWFFSCVSIVMTKRHKRWLFSLTLHYSLGWSKRSIDQQFSWSYTTLLNKISPVQDTGLCFTECLVLYFWGHVCLHTAGSYALNAFCPSVCQPLCIPFTWNKLYTYMFGTGHHVSSIDTQRWIKLSFPGAPSSNVQPIAFRVRRSLDHPEAPW